MSRLPNDAGVEDVLTPAFHELDSTITAFLQSFPAAWSDIRAYDSTLMPSEVSEPSFLSDGVNNRSSKQLNPMTADLVLAHVASYGSFIAMHEPIAAHVADSETKAAHAADAIVAIIKVSILFYFPYYDWGGKEKEKKNVLADEITLNVHFSLTLSYTHTRCLWPHGWICFNLVASLPS